MKKTFLTLIAFLIALSLCAFALVSCFYIGNEGGSNNEETHIHTVVTDEAKSPTCTEIGFTEGKHCSTCKEVIVEQKVIKAFGHTRVIDEAVEPTYTETGLTVGVHCSVCEKVLIAQNMIPMLSPGRAVLSTKTLSVEGSNISGRVSYDTACFSFSSDISVTNNAAWVLSTDSYGMQTIATKTAPLSEGENTFYIHVTNSDHTVDTYTVSLYRNRLYEVCFDTAGGTAVETQYVEEGELILAPTTTRFGYTFSSWSYDFDLPVSSDLTITAEWTVKPEMKIFIFKSTSDGCTITKVINRSVKEIVIPDYVTSIGEDAFLSCTSLTSVEIGDGVKSIGEWAFYNCTSLTSIKIPDSVESIGEDAFLSCTSLTSVEIGDSVASIGDGAFSYCTSLTSVVIGDGVTSIGENAFYFCTSLTSVVIGDSVASIGDGAFYGCLKLAEVVNQSSLNITVGSKDYGYLGYYTVEIHNGESKIVNNDGYLFYTYGGVNYLLGYTGEDTELTLPESYNGEGYEIYEDAFYFCTSLTSVVIGDGVASIGDGAFYSCTSLTSVEIGDGVKSIGERAFYNCTSLTSIKIPDSVESIGEYAFFCCRSLVSVRIGDSVASIGGGAFSGCYKLVEVINLSSLNIGAGFWSPGEVGSYAIEIHKRESKIVNKDGYLFYSYEGVNYLLGYTREDTELTLPESYNGEGYEIYEYAFYEQDRILSVVIPESVEGIGCFAFCICPALTSITVSENNDSYKSVDGNLYSRDGKTLIQYSVGQKETSFTIPEGVTSIGDGAFYFCTSLTSVVIPNSVTSIGDGAFNFCTNLTSVVIGDSVASIGRSAFCNCASLTSLEIPESVISIGAHAFGVCYKLIKKENGVHYVGKWVVDCESDVTSVVLKEDTAGIANESFSGCSSLTSVEIPESVIIIGDHAFYDCKSIASIKYHGSSSQWDSISKSKWWNLFMGSYTITYDYTDE